MGKKVKDRVFFIIKSWIMGNVGGSVFLTVVFFLGSVNLWQSIVLGGFMFVISLVVTRYFERPIDRTSFFINNKLKRFPAIRKIIHKYL